MNTKTKASLAMMGLLAASGSALSAGTGAEYPSAIASHDELFMQGIAERMFLQLPAEHQQMIAEAGGIGSHAVADTAPLCDHGEPRPLPEVDPGISAHEYLDLLVSEELAARMTDEQWNILNAIADTLDTGSTVPHMCFSPDTDREYAFAVNQLIEFPFQVRFQQTGRWTSTATNGGGLGQGTPTTLTYSFVPDGTFVPNLGIGLGSGNSQLFQWLDGIYGNTQTWQDLFHQVFDRWEELINVTYVFEPNDDGSNTNSGAGILGVRGDVRIAAYNFQNDGNGGVLAYNNFPNDGDMIFDAFDTFYSTNTSGNSLRLRNVAAHEHGHGLGMLHVCPATGTKLMEPFISTSYDGPQLDDILNGIRHYGDVNEPDDSIAQATDLGTLNIGGAAAVQNVGVDDNSDDDFFRVGLSAPARIQFLVAPAAATYDQGPQTSQCNTGSSTNYNAIQNLRITAFDASGSTLGSVNDTGLGGTETLIIDSVNGNEVFFRVDGATNVNNVQRYQVSVLVFNIPFMGPLISADVPNAVDPGVATSFDVTIDPREDDLVGGSAQLFASVNGGSFISSPLMSNGGNSYTATLPSVNCDDSLEFYISVEGDTDGVVTLPEGGASAPFSATVGELVVALDDNFESDLGWNVSGDALNAGEGRWERGVPGGDGSRGDAPSDFDGSGSCYMTGNGGPGDNTDVDETTVLISPPLNLNDAPEAIISYARWYNNAAGDNPNTDFMTVDISNNLGISWTTLETVGPNDGQSAGGWFEASFRVADFVTPTGTVLVRFTAQDLGGGSIVEAAIDAFRVSQFSCEDPDTCPADLTGDGNLDFFDVSAFLTAFNAMDPAADFNGDGMFNFFDVSEFLSAFNAGCP
jgi:hypothetical protein